MHTVEELAENPKLENPKFIFTNENMRSLNVLNL